MGSAGMRPSGTVTFLFTDVEGSTGLWQWSLAARAVVEAGLGADAEAAIAAGTELGLDGAVDLALAALEKLASQ